ncbi:DUF4442 domain-containing protein [Desulfonema ishimotonii]|uniref:DUF4442 domain-containing protein n=1 Tax=Desulfonema ishimotonii TaxID=45657 RepID=A0A401G0Q5_9BACT|nr:DUF4442 domain-containing protein [Desulfonema ishimotonii]GBC62805.1 DUF4442 domain-containing protein [Desulfonema ishimotonii]
MTPRLFKMLINLYPPYLGTGIRVTHISEGYRDLRVEMRLRFYNRNYMGSHFGGSLCAMTDPFYMLMLIQILGPEYRVWDQSANIEFIRPGRGTVSARFSIDDRILEEIRRNTADGEKYHPVFTAEIRDDDHQIVARALKRLYIRKKQRHMEGE